MIVAPFVNKLAMDKLKSDANLGTEAGEGTEYPGWDSVKSGFSSNAPLDFEEKGESQVFQPQSPPTLSQPWEFSPFERNDYDPIGEDREFLDNPEEWIYKEALPAGSENEGIGGWLDMLRKGAAYLAPTASAMSISPDILSKAASNLAPYLAGTASALGITRETPLGPEVEVEFKPGKLPVGEYGAQAQYGYDPAGGMNIDSVDMQSDATQSKKNTGYSGGASLLGNYLREMMDPGSKVY